jgi:uncharacterized protein
MKKLFIFLMVSCSAFLYSQEHQRFIDVNGTSELDLPADQINITIQIRTVDYSIERSKKSNNKHLDELLGALKDAGINSKEIQVSPITLGKNYEYIERERKHKGYFTEVWVSVLLKDLSKYFDLINDLSSNNVFEIVNSNYCISDYETQHKAAYEKALKAAKEKAEYMSKALGVNLGEVLEIEENDNWQSRSLASNTISVAEASDVSGKVMIKRSVRVKFALK